VIERIEARHRADSGLLKASPVTECGALKAHPAVEICGVESRRGVEGRASKPCLTTEIYTAGEAGILTEGGADEVGPVAEGCTGETGKPIMFTLFFS
jgi:hypothetical protein